MAGLKRTRLVDPAEMGGFGGGGGKRRTEGPGLSLPRPSSSSASAGAWAGVATSARRTVNTSDTTWDTKRRAEYQRHMDAANRQFAQWVEATLGADPMACLAEGSKDYVRIVEQLNDRYLRQHGEVFTFGSGECGQAGHGVEEERDLIVKKPRIVHSLRDKQIR